MTLDQYLSEIRAREQKATAGPWETEYAHDISNSFAPDTWRGAGPEYNGTEWQNGFSVCPPQVEADAEFIAHARTDIPRLVKMVEAALAFVAPCMCRRGFESCGSCAFRRELDRLAGEKT